MDLWCLHLILNFVRCATPRLNRNHLIEGVYARSNLSAVEKLGFTHILNMAVELNLDSTFLESRGIQVKHIAADDTINYNIRVHFEEAFQFIEDALAKNGRILVHCAVGVSRKLTFVLEEKIK